MLLKILIIFCWLWGSITHGYLLANKASDTEVQDETILERAFQGLKRSLYYMEKNYELLNLDALTALRISKGQLSQQKLCHSSCISCVLVYLYYNVFSFSVNFSTTRTRYEGQGQSYSGEHQSHY